jgi:hypothetical protein
MKEILQEIIPPFLYKLGKYVYARSHSQKTDTVMGKLVLNWVTEFSESIYAKPEAFECRLSKLIQTGDNSCSILYGDLLDAFMPNYERDLFQYYTYQQYFSLFRFLQYPFLNPELNEYVLPYKKGISTVNEARILEYGCGIPYGLIECLLTQPQRIKSIDLIDLDLIHMDFTEFVIRKISPDVPLNIYRLRNTETFPELNDSYNLFYGKDIFEHLHNPAEKLIKLMIHRAEPCVCYFDFRDRGEKIYQHVTKDISCLDKVMEDLGFKAMSKIYGITEFIKSK